MSKSVLAHVFDTSRQPRQPPIPEAWSSGKATSREHRPSVPGSRPRSASLGNSETFTHKKSQDPGAHGSDLRQNLGEASIPTSSNAASASGRPRRLPRNHRQTWSVKPGRSDTHSVGASDDNVATMNKNSPSSHHLAPQDFWGELKSRVVDHIGPASHKQNNEKVAGARLPKANNNDTAASQGHDEGTWSSAGPASRDLSGRRHGRGSWSETPVSKRKTVYGVSDETMETGPSRASKKSDKRRKDRRRRALHDEWVDEADHDAIKGQDQKQRKRAQKEQTSREEHKPVPIFLPEYISVSHLAQALKERLDHFMRAMEEMGFENTTPDSIMTGETAALIAMEYGFEPTVETGSGRDLRPRPPPDGVASLPGRPPVVTIMGHVDHGKTTLLDYLRKSSIAAQEHGGITQHIGAFVVKMTSGKSITFLDTPGHAAFLSMRQRGASVTDIVVLVVAADDSVMPQTIEALKHATAAKVPIIVAINKIDREDARIEQVKADLARHGVEIEDFGGDVQVVCVSGKTGQGMADLEENIVALSEILDVRAETDGMAEGWILESSIKQDGKAATVLVNRGTLRPGDVVVAGKTWAKIRALRNEAGAELAAVGPGSPAELLGWRSLPSAGEQVLQAPTEATAKTAVEYRLEMAEREESSAQLAEQAQRQREKAALEASEPPAGEARTPASATEQDAESSGTQFQNIVVKADVVGSVEAVCASILALGNNEVQARILRSSAGQVSEHDVDHAAASDSLIINFNMPILPQIKRRAEEAKVKMLDHSVIYHLVDDVKARLAALLPVKIVHRVVGEAEILQVFPINLRKKVFRNIAGCRVRNGSIKRSSPVKVLRRGEVIFSGAYCLPSLLGLVYAMEGMGDEMR